MWASIFSCSGFLISRVLLCSYFSLLQQMPLPHLCSQSLLYLKMHSLLPLLIPPARTSIPTVGHHRPTININSLQCTSPAPVKKLIPTPPFPAPHSDTTKPTSTANTYMHAQNHIYIYTKSKHNNCYLNSVSLKVVELLLIDFLVMF